MRNLMGAFKYMITASHKSSVCWLLFKSKRALVQAIDAKHIHPSYKYDVSKILPDGSTISYLPPTIGELTEVRRLARKKSKSRKPVRRSRTRN